MYGREGTIEQAHEIARKNSYFWEPCPLCEEYFSGKEWSLVGDTGLNMYTEIPASPDPLVQIICPTCIIEGRGTVY